MKITMNDFSDLNHLPIELKLLVVNGQTLVDKAKEKMADRELYMDLTSKALLKSDCKEIEKYIKQISKGKVDEKVTEKLNLAITRLNTNLNGIVQFFER